MEVGYLIRMDFKTPVSSTDPNKNNFQYLRPGNGYRVRRKPKHMRFGWETFEEARMAMEDYIDRALTEDGRNLREDYGFKIVKMTLDEEEIGL